MFSSDENNKQAQRAGDNSALVQAGRDITIVNGLSEERAREIARVTSEQVIAEYTAEAQKVIQDRIFKLDDKVIAALIREGRIQVFSDPGFQRSYRKAQEGAAVTERDEDYDLLTALIVDRVERGEKRHIRAGIDRAIEVIDRIDETTLRGLTVMQAVMQYRPAGGDIIKGLRVMDNLLGQLIDGPLPEGIDWVDHLDVLDAARIRYGTPLRKFGDFWPKTHMPGYISTGAEESLAPKFWDFHGEKIEWMSEKHLFKEGFVRLQVACIEDLEKWHDKFPPETVSKLLVQAEENFHVSAVDDSCSESLMDLARDLPSLRKIEEWWDKIPNAFTVTAVGKVLARANAERLDTLRVLPSL